MLLVPIMVVGLVRLNKAYEAESVELLEDAQAIAQMRTLRVHSVVVLVDGLDAASARALQYARTLTARDLRAVHFDLDPWKTSLLVQSWRDLGLSSLPLDIIECPDRRVPRAVLEMAMDITSDHDTQLTVLVPRREYSKLWHRLLHDRSSNAIAAAVDEVPHCNVTIVPYQLGSRRSADAAPAAAIQAHDARPLFIEPKTGPASANVSTANLPTDRTKIAEIVPRQRSTVAGRIRAIRIQPWGGNPAMECSLADETGSITIVFFGRQEIAGIRLGTILSVKGVASDHHGLRAILNPEYDLISTPPAPSSPHH
jgi:hypothetical protein